jgi:hypothetical protein|nr:MAG TPA: hypothetical protein [Caudoviricetes sp.]
MGEIIGKIIGKISEKLPADFVIKKGEQALIIVVSSILPTVILFYLWDEHMYYDKDLIRTIILILAVSLCTYFYYWLIACMGDTLVYGFNKDDKSEIYIIISAAFMNSITVLLSILMLLLEHEKYSKKFYLAIVLALSALWIILSLKESKKEDKYLKKIKYNHMKNTISENEEACNTYNENIKEIINVDKKIKDKQSAIKTLQIENANTEKFKRS